MTKKTAFTAALIVCFLLARTSAFAETSIIISGSTAMLPLVKDAANVYQAQHPDVLISVSGGGSGTGIVQVAAKAIDIGDSDIGAPSHPELHDNRIAVVGFAVVVNDGATVTGLTKAQIQGIFSGKIGNWKNVGGSDQRIVVINRPRTSGTRAVFTKTLMGSTPVNESAWWKMRRILWSAL